MLNDMIGPYEIVAKLGEGGMGEVYRARDPRIGREVALKVLHARGGLDPDRVARFEQEARAAGLLNHPNILTVHDVGTADGQPYIVSELLEGETLRARLERGPLPVDRARDVGAQVARGLAAAHARGVVHRDLKPENLFLTRDGRAKILDFGIAKLVAGTAALDALATAPGTVAGVVMGTAAYMSPEQVTGEPVDHRSDLFSLGTVLHEMLAGGTPFARPTTVETMTAVLKEDPPPLASDPRIPPALDRLVRRCLEKSPEERFQSARDLAFALEALTVAATPTSGAKAVPATVSAHDRGGRIAWWWTVVAAGCALAAAWIVWRPLPNVTPRFSRIVKIVSTDAIESSPVLSPDGQWFAYVSDEGGRLNLWVRYLGGGRSINLTANATDLYLTPVREIGGLDISPDGRQIVFPATTDPNLLANQQASYVIDAPLGGTPRKLMDRALGARWSPDGSRIAYVLPGGTAGDGIGVADATGEHARVVLQVAGGMHAHWPAWSADGRYIYFNRSAKSANSEPAEIHRVPAEGGAEETVIGTSRRAIYPYPTLDGRGLLYSANPDSVDLAIWWKPWAGEAVRLTTGVGEYAEARLSADGRRMLATAYDIRQSLAMLPVEGGIGVPARLSQGASGDNDPAVSPAGDRLACSSTRSGDRNIWTMRLDGSDPRQITTGLALDERPAWSPDGKMIAFVSTRGNESGIWVVAADGGPPSRVVATEVLNTVTWSPDGRELVYAAPRGGTATLFRVPVDGGTPAVVPTPTAASAPHWSAAANAIAYTASVLPSGGAPGRTWVALVRPSGESMPLAHELRLGNGIVAWSPDGRYVAGLGIPGGAAASIWIMAVDGQTPPRRLIEFSGEARPRGVTWSPDGRSLIFGLQERTADIVLFDAGS